ncbi:MAG: HEAT repeat domain-containing protein, partial [Candidatus Thiodiazotropha sp. (ex Ustalcina ferruginea)]|nr:HEAT repeat domain-containing protein [Candidatus Thiodiazotropha sp. (ex Ustalcina ferruginea)]
TSGAITGCRRSSRFRGLGSPEIHHEIKDSLVPMLNDPSSQVRATLLNVLAPVVANNPLSNEHYKVVISSSFDTSAETAAAACRLLGENRNSDAISTLLEHARNQNGHPMVRREAILSIGQFGEISDEIIDVLVNAVGDSQQPVRLAALTALMSLDEQRIETDELTQDKQTPPRPLSIIIDAVRGSIHVPDKATSVIEPEDIGNVQQAPDNASEANVQNGVVVEFETEVEKVLQKHQMIRGYSRILYLRRLQKQ